MKITTLGTAFALAGLLSLGGASAQAIRAVDPGPAASAPIGGTAVTPLPATAAASASAGASAAGSAAPAGGIAVKPGKPLAETALILEDAFRPPEVIAAALSPDAKHMAMIAAVNGVVGVLLVPVDSLLPRMIITGRVVVQDRQLQFKFPQRVTWLSPDLMAVDYGFTAEAHDLSGKSVMELGTSVIGRARPDDPTSAEVLVFDDLKRRKMMRVDVKTRQRERVDYPESGSARAWAFDALGRLRAIALSTSWLWRESTTFAYWYRPADGSAWQKLEDSPVTADHWLPLAADAKSDRLIVMARHQRDTRALFEYDPLKRQFGEMMAGHDTEDLTGFESEAFDAAFKRVMSFGMKPAVHWFDARWAASQAGVDKALPGRINHLFGQVGGLALVYSYADVDPGRWFIFDQQAKTLQPVATANKRIDPDRMRPMEVIRYAAKDGLKIPAYLTRPAPGGTVAAGPQPTVVMVHGGPAVRDTWHFDPMVQMLAARGYVVLQPQFRGSAGFGRAFEVAGHGQWGRAMQDDITAGVEHLVAQGIADPARVCIVGASYGGYAALWGLVKTPQLYRCGASLSGVSDIGEMLTDWSDLNDSEVGQAILHQGLGYQADKKGQFDDVSPQRGAKAIQVPVFIAHGTEDKRVPVGHAKRMVRALEEHGKTFEWMPLERQGHSLSAPIMVNKVLPALLSFLDRHIGSGAKPVPAPAASAPR